MYFDLDIDRAIREIKKKRAKFVCIQLPDGLKPKANKIQEELEGKTKADVIIWIGSCFGACDVPLGLDKLGVDLLVQWGHSEFKQ
ncbi:MAG: diphthamide synthesis protein [Candidatus Woesearchaeota archaeon]|jgi:diphthamide biosynthesis enzyme Dph1/Dph2-like protein|nr:diphthamide synthesis protein [Candidatus Woesearchaeota archaeon]MDP7506153.1 diphthamide synthesis protein [Candidatus Woesearchaeota archaeon]MDP7610353.1 diphthamide synthesis protein [Candidatus Woesearchaeota archaeon]|tara:strand:+ start:2429 stop:2683 length:255 start_codon:yes stop_codon:yes gene_type:complete